MRPEAKTSSLAKEKHVTKRIVRQVKLKKRQVIEGSGFVRLLVVSTPSGGSGGRAPYSGSRTLGRWKTSAKFQ